jgi:MFS family permease
LLAGDLLSALGSSMTAFAVTLQVWDLSRSSFAVGALGFTFVPVLILGLVGGSIADHVDRRRLALVAIVAQSGVSALFAVQAFAGSGCGRGSDPGHQRVQRRHRLPGCRRADRARLPRVAPVPQPAGSGTSRACRQERYKGWRAQCDIYLRP